MRLDGKVAIVTGASSGIGRAATYLFAKEGARLVLGARRQDKLDEIIADIRDAGGKAIAVSGDVRDEAYASALVEAAQLTYGGLDIGFNNAGALGAVADISTLTTDDWRKTLQTNLDSAFFGAKYQAGAMRERGGGSILFTSSFVGHTIGFPHMTAYATSKAGLIGMAQCLAVELGSIGIRVNTLLPGGTKTPMVRDFSEDSSAVETIARFHALARMAEPEEIAHAALFLASDEASFVTGSALVVDGGNSITKSAVIS